MLQGLQFPKTTARGGRGRGGRAERDGSSTAAPVQPYGRRRERTSAESERNEAEQPEFARNCLKSPDSRKNKTWILLPSALDFLPQKFDFPSNGFENPSTEFVKSFVSRETTAHIRVEMRLPYS